MIGELIKNISEEEGEYKPIDGPEIGSLILMDRGQLCMACLILKVNGTIEGGLRGRKIVIFLIRYSF